MADGEVAIAEPGLGPRPERVEPQLEQVGDDLGPPTSVYFPELVRERTACSPSYAPIVSVLSRALLGANRNKASDNQKLIPDAPAIPAIARRRPNGVLGWQSRLVGEQCDWFRWPGWAFTIAWTAVLALTLRVFLWQMAYELHLDGDEFSWKAPLHSGTVRLSDIRELRPVRWARNSELIRLADGTLLMVYTGKGFSLFIDDIIRQAPDLPVRVRPFFSQVLESGPFRVVVVTRAVADPASRCRLLHFVRRSSEPRKLGGVLVACIDFVPSADLDPTGPPSTAPSSASSAWIRRGETVWLSAPGSWSWVPGTWGG